jgi:hypothetical protein
MKDWAPFFQTLVWPLFLGIVLFQSKGLLAQLLKAVEERIVAGAEFEAGTSGIRFGPAPKAGESGPAPAVKAESVKAESVKAESGEAPRPGEEAPTPGDIYLVHTVRRDRALSTKKLPYYSIRLYLDAEEDTTLDNVSEVVYYIHHTAAEPVVVVRNRETSFEVRFSIWGEFNTAAYVYFKDRTKLKLKLERYLNI